jgi:hypothetical protein
LRDGSFDCGYRYGVYQPYHRDRSDQ